MICGCSDSQCQCDRFGGVGGGGGGGGRMLMTTIEVQKKITRAGLLVIYLIISLIMFKWRFRVKLIFFTVVFSSDCQYLFIVPTL